MMKDIFNAFFNKWDGKPCEVNDPSNLNQCMDLLYAWCDALKITRDTVRHLYASQVYTNPTDVTLEFFELRPNTAMFIPQVGDVAVFHNYVLINGVKVDVGHVSVCNGKGDTNAFESFDQNWGTTVNKCGTIRHSYDNVIGFLRFRVAPVPEINDQTLLPIIDSSGKQMEVQAVRSKLGDQEMQITKLLTEQDKLLRQIDELKINMIALDNTITDLNVELKRVSELPTAIHDILYGSGWWWQKWAKIKALIPEK